MKRKHPDQPFVVDERGVLRFRRNELVRELLDKYPGGLNSLLMLGYSIEDREQLYQLIGYSFSGYQETSEFPDSSIDRLSPAAKKTWDKYEKKQKKKKMNNDIPESQGKVSLERLGNFTGKEARAKYQLPGGLLWKVRVQYTVDPEVVFVLFLEPETPVHRSVRPEPRALKLSALTDVVDA